MNTMFDELSIGNFQLPWSTTEDPNFQANPDLDDPFGAMSGSDLDFNFDWDPLNDALSPLSPLSSPVVIPNHTFPPSPSTSVETQSPTSEQLTLEEYLRRTAEGGTLDIYGPLSNEVAPPSIHENITTPPYSNYPSPSQSIKPELMTSPQSQTPTSPPALSTAPPRRRGPGRPSKAQQLLEGKKPSARTLMTMRRQFHNDSATRSRARFNNVLTELWQEVPEAKRTHFLGNDDAARQVCRAEKIETVISYIRKLQRTLRVHGLHLEE